MSGFSANLCNEFADPNGGLNDMKNRHRKRKSKKDSKRISVLCHFGAGDVLRVDVNQL